MTGSGRSSSPSSGSYELVVLDLLLPHLDGMSVLQGLMETRPDQRVLVLSALSDVETKVRCLEFGASDYLSKPFSLAELIARVRARLRQPGAGPRHQLLRGGGMTLDLTRRIVEVDGRRVTLSEREFLLLEHLMRQEGDVAAASGCSPRCGGTRSTRAATWWTCVSDACGRSSAAT